MRAPRVLVVDDQADVVTALKLLLKSEGFGVVTAQSPEGALALARDEELAAALVDMNYARDTTSGNEGLDLVGRLLATSKDLPVIVMTAWGSVEGAVAAMRRGARDYVEKPWKNERLMATLRREIQLADVGLRAARLGAQSARENDRALPELVAVSKAMEPVKRLVARVAASDANVLVTGEHGTGKDVVARWIHAASPRASRPFVPVNAGALADGVFESELFGHVKGAFTDAKSDRIGCFELADGGTLFLDEIGTMPPGQQAKLLRVLQSGELTPVGSSRTRTVDVRVVSATNVDVAASVARGEFREDLLFRLDTVEVRLPPLRERPEDVPALAAHFLAKKAARYGKTIERFSSEASVAMAEHAWPGNVRELEHVVERAVVLAEGATIELADLHLRRAGSTSAAVALERMTLADAEAYLVRRAMERAPSANAAAEALGLSRSALYRRLQVLGITEKE